MAQRKAFTPSEWKLSNDQKVKLLRAANTGQLTHDNSLAFRRLCDMGFAAYDGGKVVITERGKAMIAYLS